MNWVPELFFLTDHWNDTNDNSYLKARSSGGERYPDTVEVLSSNLSVPTSYIKYLGREVKLPALCFWIAVDPKTTSGYQCIWQRELLVIGFIRFNQTSTNYNKPCDGLTASKGYILKRKFGWYLKGFLGVRAPNSGKNGIWGSHHIGRVIKNDPAFLFLILQYCWFER